MDLLSSSPCGQPSTADRELRSHSARRVRPALIAVKMPHHEGGVVMAENEPARCSCDEVLMPGSTSDD